MPGSKPTRLQLLEQVERLVDAAARPHTVAELSRTTGLHRRTVYRLLAALPASDYRVLVDEEPRVRGRGRPTRRYTIARVVAATPHRVGKRATTRARRALDQLERALGALERTPSRAALARVVGLVGELRTSLDEVDEVAASPAAAAGRSPGAQRHRDR